MINYLFVKYPFVSRINLGVLFFSLAIISTGIIEKVYTYKKYFPFTGMIFLLLATWFLYKIDRKNLSELGLKFSIRNYKFLFLGFIIGIFALYLANILKTLLTGQTININELFKVELAFLGLYYILPNVVVEELLYRGYLFKKVINKTNIIIANIIFSMLFMLVHVLDTKILSSLGAIIMMSVTIPIGHLLFATALLKSKTLLFPIGLHIGNNMSTKHLITEILNEQSLLYKTGTGSFDTWPSFIAFVLVWNGFYLLLTYIIWKWPIKPSTD